MATLCLETYGCTLNQADSDVIKGILRAREFRVLSPDKINDADVFIINTCTVKSPTENKILNHIARLRTQDRRLVICGCMSVMKERIRRIAPYAVLVWPAAIAHIADAVEDALAGRITEYKSGEPKDTLNRLFTKPILRIPIGEGCTSKCHFCQTKLARPKLLSLQPNVLLAWIKEGVGKGAREVQLTAMDCGVYGMDIGTDLPSLMQCINSIGGDFSARLGMLNPQHALRLGKRLLDALAGQRFYKFLHVPVQSGSGKVVREMGRQHTVADFATLVRMARKCISGITIATDIIVGYPTETEKDFGKTMALIKRIKPDIVNISKFSPRPGTEAKELRQLPTQTVKARSRALSALVKRLCRENNERMVGKKVEVLVTEKQKSYTGRMLSYKQVVIKKGKVRLGSRVKVMLTGANHGSLFGEIL